MMAADEICLIFSHSSVHPSVLTIEPLLDTLNFRNFSEREIQNAVYSVRNYWNLLGTYAFLATFSNTVSTPQVSNCKSIHPSVRQYFQKSSLKPIGQSNSKILYGDSLGLGNESLFKWSWCHDQDGCHAHIW